MDDALETTGIWTIKQYINQSKATIASQMTCRTVYELCTGAERMPGASKFLRWSDQDVGREVD